MKLFIARMLNRSTIMFSANSKILFFVVF